MNKKSDNKFISWEDEVQILINEYGRILKELEECKRLNSRLESRMQLLEKGRSQEPMILPPHTHQISKLTIQTGGPVLEDKQNGHWNWMDDHN